MSRDSQHPGKLSRPAAKIAVAGWNVAPTPFHGGGSSSPFASLNLKGRAGRIQTWAHCFDGLLLLLFAGSHFLMLTVPSSSFGTINTVFPFLTNGVLYFLAGILEMAVGGICLWKRGRSSANLAIFLFLTVIVWYRLALRYTGTARSCECLGALGRALHLSKAQEHVVPLVALGLLSVTILPGLGSIFRFTRRSGLGAAKVLALGLLALPYNGASGQQTLRVTGTYEVQHCNPGNGTEYANAHKSVSFCYTLSGAAWTIFATNIGPGGEGWRTPWEGLIYDGTNTYTLTPKRDTPTQAEYQVRATISRGPLYLRDFDEWLDFDVIWVTYGLCPNLIPTNQSGNYEIPLPWSHPRNDHFAYGFDWKIVPSADRRFISRCEVVRNTNLDLTFERELRRPTINPPKDLGQLGLFREGLVARKAIKTNGLVEMAYRCTDWRWEDGVAVPMRSEEKLYAGQYDGTNPVTMALVSASNVSVHPGLEELKPTIMQEIQVADYRFRRESKTRILPYIQYSMAPGDQWRPDNDPGLLRLAAESLKFGGDITFAESRHRSYLAWMFLALIVAPAIILFKVNREKQRKDQRE